MLSLTLLVTIIGIALILNDSPRHLLMIDEPEKAIEVQEWICGMNGIDLNYEFGESWKRRIKDWAEV